MNAPFSLAGETAIASKADGVPRLQIVVILVLAIIARMIFWDVRPPDMGIFLEPWFGHIVHYGPVRAFAHPFSNYEPAYLYLLALGSLANGLLTPMTIIKILSACGTIFLTLAVAELLKTVEVPRRNALLLLVLPSVVFNDALFAQCDALWAGADIFALAMMIRGQTFRAMVWCGLAVAFKAQAAFIAPVMIGAMIGRRAPWWHWAVPITVFMATLVPAWLSGWPGMKLLTVYLDQAAWDQIPGRLANPWMLGTIFADHASRAWFPIGYAAAAAAALLIGGVAARHARNPGVLILLGALAGTALPFLLPKMLERYYFLGDVLTLVLAFALRNRPAFLAMLAVQMASILSHVTLIYFFYEPYLALVGAVFAAAGLAIMCELAWPNVKSLAADARLRLGGRRPPSVAIEVP